MQNEHACCTDATRGTGGSPVFCLSAERARRPFNGTLAKCPCYEMLQANTPDKSRLLILDEDRIILSSLSQFLRREGYDVRTCDRAEEAIALLENGQIALLLADVNMPG